MTEKNQKEFVTFYEEKLFVENGLLYIPRGYFSERLMDLDEMLYDLSELEGLSELKTIKKFHMYDRDLDNIDALKPLTSLESITVTHGHSGGSFFRLLDFSNFVNLKTLHLQMCHIDKIEGMDNLKKLELLDMPYNDIKKIEGLDKLITLKELLLPYNAIELITGIQNLDQLEFLDLHGNKISTLKGVSWPPNLKHLTLGRDKFRTLDLRGLPESLEGFRTIDGKIIKIEGIQKMPNLKNLTFVRDYRSHINGVDEFKSLNEQCVVKFMPFA